jgi:hypothetical protein
MDYVITVCDRAAESPGLSERGEHEHRSRGPSRRRGSAEDRIAAFRLARDAIRARVGEFVTALEARADDA